MTWKRPANGGCGRSAIGCGRCTGSRSNEPHGHPIAELIKTVLSQHTNDRNRDRSFAAPARALPDLGGGARGAASRRSRRRSARAGSPGRRRRGSRRSSSSSASTPTSTGPRPRRARSRSSFLLSLPGVGRKTAACVLIFTWGIPEIPVDVHVHRVGGRLGLLPAEGLLRARARRDARDRRPRGRLRAAHEPDPPRARALPPETALRRVRAASHVPLVPCRRRRNARMSKNLHRLRAAGRFPRGPDPLARLPLRTATRPRRRAGAGRPEVGPEPLPDQLRHLPHALRGGDRRQLRARTSTNCWRPSGPPEGPKRRRRSKRSKAASSTRSKTASTAAPPRAGCPAASSTASRPKEVAEFVAPPPARVSGSRSPGRGLSLGFLGRDVTEA